MSATFFAPKLYIKSGLKDVNFYIEGFGAVELRRFTNDDSTLHVAELSIDGAIFHVHEEKSITGRFAPAEHNGITTNIGLFVPDVDAFITKAVAAGATLLSPAQDYEYGYRQGEIRDPFGHVWTIQKKI